MKSLLVIEPKLLSHPWYRKWECGELPVDSLRVYAREYYWQVAKFPRYLSRVHSQMEDLKDRQAILRNLSDEENESAPHPELWLDFAESLGVDRRSVVRGSPGAAASALIEEFCSLTSASAEEGLGAILAYESQVPEIASFKSKALKRHYFSEENATQGCRFFAVHEEADVWHTKELEEMVSRMRIEQKEKAQKAAHRACKALWGFLDAMPN